MSEPQPHNAQQPQHLDPSGSAPERGEQLALEALPTMRDLDALQAELDDIDQVLLELEGDRPDRRANDRPSTPPIPSQSENLEPAQ